jgi:hypothetical protein
VGDSPDVGARYTGGSWRNGRRIAWRPSLRAAPRLAAARCAQDASLLAAAPGQEELGCSKKRKKGRRLGGPRATGPRGGSERGRARKSGGLRGEENQMGRAENNSVEKRKKARGKERRLGPQVPSRPTTGEERGGGKKARLGRTQGDRPKREGKGFSIYFSYLSHNSSLRMHNSQTLSLKQQRFIIQHDATTKEKISRVYY